MKHAAISYANCYERLRAGDDLQSSLVEQLVDHYLNGKKPADILDLGCGPGRLSIPLCRAGHRLVCVDRDPEALISLRQRADAIGVHPVAILSNIESLPKEALGAFDVLLVFHVIHWLASTSVIADAATCLRPDGLLVLSYFDRNDLSDMLFYQIVGPDVLDLQRSLTPSSETTIGTLSARGFHLLERTKLPVVADYGAGALETIVEATGTLALREFLSRFGSDAYGLMASEAAERARMLRQTGRSLTDAEVRTVLVFDSKVSR